MQFAQPSRRLAANEHARAAARVKRRVRCSLGADNERPRDSFHVRLEVEQIHVPLAAIPLQRLRRTKRQTADAKRLLDTLGIAKKTGAGLEYTHPFLLAIDIRAQGIDQTAQQRRAHHIEMTGNRVEHLYRIRIIAKRALPGRADKAEGDDFLIVAIDQALTQRRERTLGLRSRKHRLPMRGQGGNDVLVTEQSRDLLDEVFLDDQVETVRGRRDDKIAALVNGLELEPCKDAGDFVRRNSDAQNAADPSLMHANEISAWQLAEHVDQIAGLAATDFQDELRRAVDCIGRPREIDAALETETGIGHETEATGLPLDHFRIPERALKKDAPSIFADAAMLPAHDSGQAEGFALIGDQQKIGIKRNDLAVEQRQFFAGRRKPNDDIAFEPCVVVGMQRLAKLEHDVVGDIDDG